MTKDHIKYEQRIQHALRGVIKDVLAETARTGLAGEHYFYISFATMAPGVVISKQLLHEHPEDMTIILQHQYEDLSVSEHQFSVQLRFADKIETLVVPFAALTRFYDPSVNFGLAFDHEPDEDMADGDKKGLDEFYSQKPNGDKMTAKPPRPPSQAQSQKTQAKTKPQKTQAKTKPQTNAHIVDLDSIRRKKNPPPQQK